MSVADLTLYMTHLKLEPELWMQTMAIAAQQPRLIRPKEYNLLPPEEDSAKMQAKAESVLGPEMFTFKQPDT